MANRYWVGGTATWDGTIGLKWALTSGGVGGQLAPTSADTVFFDANSGANTVTLGTGYNPTISTLTMTGFTGTLAFGSQFISCGGSGTTIFTGASTYSVTGTPLIKFTYSGSTGVRVIAPNTATEANAISISISAGSDVITANGSYLNLNFTGFTGSLTNIGRTIYGSLTLGTGMTCNDGTLGTTFSSTLVQQNITSNGVSFNVPINFSGTQTYQLQDALTIASARQVTFNTGILDLNNKTLTCGLFSSSNSNTRSIAFGTGNITLTGSGATIWTTSTPTNLTITGTPTVNATYSGSTGTRTFTAGTATGNQISLNVSAGSDIVTTGGVSVFTNLNFTGFSGTLSNLARSIYGNLTISSGMTCTSGAATISFLGTSGTQQITTSGKTLDFPLTFSGTATYQFQDALTQGSTRIFTFSAGTLQLKAGVTNTVGTFATSGTTLKYLKSTVPGTQATISQSSGTVNVSYLSIQDNNATGGIWQAPSNQNNIIVSNVTGWFTSDLFNSIISESGVASDVQLTLNSLTINEFGNALDTQSETISALVSLTELGNAIDTISENMISSVTVTETGNAQDSVSQNVVAYLTVIEAGIAIDYQTENAIALLAIAESGLASDAVSEQMTAYAQMLESANAEDALTANMIAQAHIVEAGLAQDLVNQVLIASANISEAALAQDSTNGTTYVIVAVLEQGNAVDIYVCAPIFQKSDLVWHVSPRPTNWQVAQRQNYWQVSPRQDYWQAHE